MISLFSLELSAVIHFLDLLDEKVLGLVSLKLEGRG
jgi:hypothetical protein